MEKLYVLVRNDLSKSQQAVQGGHAVAKYLLDNPNTSWNNGTLVYLKVPSESRLWREALDISVAGKPVSLFREPDRHNELTAIACVSEGHEFSGLRLM